MNQIVAVSAPFPGVVKHLKNMMKIVDGEFFELKQGVGIPDADMYILGAWSDEYDKILPRLQGKVGFLWTSSPGEVGLEPVEIEQLSIITRMLQQDKIDFIIFTTKVFEEVFKEIGKVKYIPHPVVDIKEKYNIEIPEKEDIITMMCPSTSKKNIFNQLLAVKIIQEKTNLILHTNLKEYESVMKWLGLNFKLYKEWVPEKEYYKLLARSKINLAVSFSESFNYNVCESGLLETPSVISRSVPCLSGMEELIVDNPNSPLKIAKKIRYILDNPELQNKVRKHLLKLKEKHNSVLKKEIESFK